MTVADPLNESRIAVCVPTTLDDTVRKDDWVDPLSPVCEGERVP